MCSSPSGSKIYINEVPVNVYSPIDFTLSGTLIISKFPQPENVSRRIAVIDDDNFPSFKLVQRKNTPLPIDTTMSGVFTYSIIVLRAYSSLCMRLTP